jgi:hypothetical protein
MDVLDKLPYKSPTCDLTEIRPVGAVLIGAGGPTDMAKLMGASRKLCERAYDTYLRHAEL